MSEHGKSIVVGHVCHSDGDGGAARAAYRLHSALRSTGVSSSMFVVKKTTDDRSVYGNDTAYQKLSYFLRFHLAKQISSALTRNDSGLRSLALFSGGLIKKVVDAEVDVINLHWVGAETIGLKELTRIDRPLVWRVADMWPFCGAEHYSGVDANARWRIGYTETQSPESFLFDIDSSVWKRKKKYIPAGTTLVGTTNFVSNCLRESELFRHFKIVTIPNALDTQVYRPLDKDFCRAVLGLPSDQPIVLFGAIGGGADPRKGMDLLMNALRIVASENKQAIGVVFGQSAPEDQPKVGMPIRWLGHVHDDLLLSIIYSAADVMVVPSRQETFGQTASEAQACGVPVVAFNCTGLADVVDHNRTGYLADPYDYEDLASGILELINNPAELRNRSINARCRALNSWSYSVVANAYTGLYRSLL